MTELLAFIALLCVVASPLVVVFLITVWDDWKN